MSTKQTSPQALRVEAKTPPASSFPDLWKSLEAEEKTELARRAETSVAYLSHVANGRRNAGRRTIERLLAADDRITLQWFFDSGTRAPAQQSRTTKRAIE